MNLMFLLHHTGVEVRPDWIQKRPVAGVLPAVRCVSSPQQDRWRRCHSNFTLLLYLCVTTCVRAQWDSCLAWALCRTTSTLLDLAGPSCASLRSQRMTMQFCGSWSISQALQPPPVHPLHQHFLPLLSPASEVGLPWLSGVRWCPEESCSWFSKLWFLFPNSLMRLGASKTLEPDDLWDLARSNEASGIHAKYEEQLQKTASLKYPHVRCRCAANVLPLTPSLPHAPCAASREPAPLLHGTPVPRWQLQTLALSHPPDVRLQGSVWTALMRAFGPKWALAGLVKLVHDCVNLSSPYILRQLLKHKKTSGDMWVGLGWSVALFATGVVTALLVNQYFLWMFNTCLYVKAALIQALYAKSLRVSIPAKNELGGGAIANLQSNDAQKLWTLANYGHVLWSGPFQVRKRPPRTPCLCVKCSTHHAASPSPIASSYPGPCAAVHLCRKHASTCTRMYQRSTGANVNIAAAHAQVFVIIWLLHRIVGPLPALAGLAVTIMLVPLNTVIGKVVHKFRKDLIAKTDARVKLVSEIINGAPRRCAALPLQRLPQSFQCFAMCWPRDSALVSLQAVCRYLRWSRRCIAAVSKHAHSLQASRRSSCTRGSARTPRVLPTRAASSASPSARSSSSPPSILSSFSAAQSSLRLLRFGRTRRAAASSQRTSRSRL
jgi:ABC transporter transmembrane region